MGHGISSRGMTNVLYFYRIRLSDMLRGDCRVRDKRETHVEAVTLTQESDGGGMDQGCSNKSVRNH